MASATTKHARNSIKHLKNLIKLIMKPIPSQCNGMSSQAVAAIFNRHILDNLVKRLLSRASCRLSVVPRGRHCWIHTILPSMSLKNAPSPGRAYRRALKKSADFSLFKPRFRIKRNPVKGSNLDCAHVFTESVMINVALDIDFSTSPTHQKWRKKQILFSWTQEKAILM